MLNLHDPLVQVRVTCVACSSAAILSTLFRMLIRRKRFWVDDVVALFSLLALIVQIGAVFITPRSGSTIGVTRYYIIAVTFFSIIWRVTQIPQSGHSSGAYIYRFFCTACAFAIIPILLILQCFLTCAPKTHWKSAAIPQCVLDNSNAICQLIADILSDGILLYVPTRLLMILSDRELRHRLILIFSTCVLTSLVGLAHTIEIFKVGHVKVLFAAIVENNIALIICNTPVILTSLIDLKEAPWEERNLFHEQRNLELLAASAVMHEGGGGGVATIGNQQRRSPAAATSQPPPPESTLQ